MIINPGSLLDSDGTRSGQLRSVQSLTAPNESTGTVRLLRIEAKDNSSTTQAIALSPEKKPDLGKAVPGKKPDLGTTTQIAVHPGKAVPRKSRTQEKPYPGKDRPGCSKSPYPGKKPYLSAEINCRTQEKPDPGKTDLGTAKSRTQESRT